MDEILDDNRRIAFMQTLPSGEEALGTTAPLPRRACPFLAQEVRNRTKVTRNVLRCNHQCLW